MFATRWPLFRLRGIPVSADSSWLFIVVLLTISLVRVLPAYVDDVYPGAADQYSATTYWVAALWTAVGFFACILLHELGHAIVAQAQGMPIRGITLFMFGGVAEIGDEPKSAGDEIRMALAGPAVSLLLAITFALAAWAGYRTDSAPLFVIVCGHLASINFIVILFNMIPAFPLDGGRVLRGILWSATGSLRRSTYWASLSGRVFSWVLIGWGILNFAAGNWLGGIWIALIGMFLGSVARHSYTQVLLRETLEGEPVRRFMNTNPITVPPDATLRQLVEDFVFRYHRKSFPVISEGRLQGVVETRSLENVPRSEWTEHTVAEVMRRDLDSIAINADEDSHIALRRMQSTGCTRLPVVEAERLVGMISLKDLMRFFTLKSEFDGTDSVPNEAARSRWTPPNSSESVTRSFT